VANKTVNIYERVKVDGKWRDWPVVVPKLKPDGKLYLKDDRDGLCIPGFLATLVPRNHELPANGFRFVPDRLDLIYAMSGGKRLASGVVTDECD
jgi:hypothetical protein